PLWRRPCPRASRSSGLTGPSSIRDRLTLPKRETTRRRSGRRAPRSSSAGASMRSARPRSASSGAALSAKARCRIPPVSGTRRAAAERERRRGLLAAPERAALGELVDVVRHTGGLAREKSLDGIGELRMPQPVGGPSHLREEAARELVLALRAALEDADPARDAELERLVVAGLEVQARHVAGGAPVPTVKGLAGEDVKCACDRLAFPLGDTSSRCSGNTWPRRAKNARFR